MKLSGSSASNCVLARCPRTNTVCISRRLKITKISIGWTGDGLTGTPTNMHIMMSICALCTAGIAPSSTPGSDLLFPANLPFSSRQPSKQHHTSLHQPSKQHHTSLHQPSKQHHTSLHQPPTLRLALSSLPYPRPPLPPHFSVISLSLSLALRSPQTNKKHAPCSAPLHPTPLPLLSHPSSFCLTQP